VEAPARDLAALATIALLFAAVLQVMLLARHRREVEARLDQAHAELDSMRERFAEATRPPAQFARMHLRETAVYRFARLRRAIPHHRRLTDVTQGSRDLAH
jgi:type II secretory pathway pseudopilin PulG